jgi:NADH:ubiquinone oxidoreductase subunit E
MNAEPSERYVFRVCHTVACPKRGAMTLTQNGVGK